MSEGSEAARGKRQAAAGGHDRLGALPDELLQEVLSFLPSPEAVRTCVLAHRWGDLWKRVLIFLLLVDCAGRAPLLQSMSLLVEASVRLQNCADRCRSGYEVGDCGYESCWGCRNSNYRKNTCVLLQGLSSCMNLKLIAGTAPFILRKDLMRCPIFSKLKTLLLNEWCITTNLDALICFLQHSPALEKLTLLFPKMHENLVETGANYDLRKQPLVLKDLTVEVICHKDDEQVHKVLDVLDSYGLPPENIMIEQYLELIRI